MIDLRRIESSDLAQIMIWRNDPRIYQWCRQNAPLHWAKHVEWYEWQAKDPSVSMFLVMNNFKPIGVCGLTSIDLVNRRAEFSIYIGYEHHDNGYGKESLIEILCYGFYDLGLNRIWGESFDGNPALGLFSEMGMESEGIRKEFYYRDGKFIDAHLVSIGRVQFDSLMDKLPII